MSHRRISNVIAKRLLSYDPISSASITRMSVRRVHQHHNEQYRWKSSTNNYYAPIVAGLAAGLGYVVLNVSPNAECHKEEQPAISDDNCDAVWSKCESLTFHDAIRQSDELLQQIKIETNSPGLVVAVSVDGKQVWSKGYGLADVENAIPCKPSTVLRIASISKPITMVAVARLWEEGKLDFDQPIQHYVSYWPEKSFRNQKAGITTRQLVSMMAGIRHYDKQCGKKKVDKDEKRKNEKSNQKNKAQKSDEFENQEYYINQFYPSIAASIDLFKNDELCSLPGTEFLYSTYSWNLVSAVIEGASGGKKFTDVMKTTFQDLGLENTYLDENIPIIRNRAKYYVVDKKTSRIVNARFVDNSYKWSGGGFLSTAPDLCHFGNAMLYSYQWSKETSGGAAAGYLRPDTVRMLWTPVAGTKLSWDRDGSYAMGWGVVTPPDPANDPGYCRNRRHYMSHTGGAVGASSALVILPRKEEYNESETVVKTSHLPPPPRGVVVAIIVNMQSASLNRTALRIANLFDSVPTDRNN